MTACKMDHSEAMQEESTHDDELIVDEDQDDSEPTRCEYDIAVYPSDLTLRVFEQMLSKGDITIPKFQRRFVWSIKQSSLLIESFLLGLPVPPIFLYVDDQNRNLVIDGQQRISTVVSFFRGYFEGENQSSRRRIFRLQGLPEDSRYFKKRFEDLDQADQRKLENSILRAINVRQLSPDKDQSSIFHIFERLNTGGTALRPQEIRNCVYSGKLVDELNNINELYAWRQLLGRTEPEKRQRDVELILRVFALWDRWEDYERPMKGFLNAQMSNHRNGNSKEFSRFKRAFPLVVSQLIEKLGPKPFHVQRPLNVAALDSIVSLSVRNQNNLPDDMATRLKRLFRNEAYIDAISSRTSDVQSIQTRMTLADETLFGA